MAYKALYLKYRPQTFEDVAGQAPIVRTLKNALANDKIAHAYLFAGPRGTGKTTMARLLAKALNCDEGMGHQCNHCSNCEEITSGSHPDVIEIDAASNNGVEQARDLIEKVSYAPIKGRYKVYIIDEVHMMSDAAFNALLKTIEEPPEKVVFILCTTEPHEVIPTILSRCQRFDFGKISEIDMKEKIIHVLEEEGAEYDEGGIRSVLKLSDGGMRDALSILDQILAYSGNSVRAADVLTIYGLASDEEKTDLLISIAKGDIPRIIGKTGAYISSGIDIRRLVGELIAFLKDLLIYSKTKDPSLMDDLDEDNAKALSAVIDNKKALLMLDEFIKTQNDFKNVNDIRSLFELSLIKLASGEVSLTTQSVEKKPYIPPRATPKKETPKPLEAGIGPLPQLQAKKEEPKEESKIPDFLFEEDRPRTIEKPKPVIEEKPKEELKPIDVSKINKPNIAINGPAYQLDDEQLINIMILADKAERTELVKNWARLEPLKMDLTMSALASLLCDGKPYALCKDALIVSYRVSTKAEKANIIANQEPISQLVETILGRKIFVYAIDPDVQKRAMDKFFGLQQLSQLPKRDQVQLKLPNK